MNYIFLLIFLFSYNLICQTVPEISESVKPLIFNEQYVQTFKYGTPSQKLSVVSQIKKTKNDNDIAMLVEYYANESNVKVKSEIINLFKQVKSDKAKDIIDYAIKDESSAIRKEAYYLISIYPDIKYESYIMEAISNESGSVLDGMINALASIKSTALSDYLLEKYNNESLSSSTKVEILRYFGETKDPKGEAISRNAARNAGESVLVRYMGIVALGSYPSLENYEILQELLEEGLPEVTARVIYILPEYGAYGDVKRDIMEAAKSDSDSVRIYAIRALNDYKTDGEVEELLLYRLKNDNSENITMEILNLYDDSVPSSDMLEAIKTLSTSSASKKVKDKANAVMGARDNENSERQ